MKKPDCWLDILVAAALIAFLLVVAQAIYQSVGM